MREALIVFPDSTGDQSKNPVLFFLPGKISLSGRGDPDY